MAAERASGLSSGRAPPGQAARVQAGDRRSLRNRGVAHPIDQERSRSGRHRPPVGAGVRSGRGGRFGLRVAVFQPTAERMDDGQADDEQTDADEDLEAAFFCLEPNFARSGE